MRFKQHLDDNAGILLFIALIVVIVLNMIIEDI